MQAYERAVKLVTAGGQSASTTLYISWRGQDNAYPVLINEIIQVDSF